MSQIANEKLSCTMLCRQESTQIRETTKALIQKADIMRSHKQVYQWLHRKDLCPPKLFFKSLTDLRGCQGHIPHFLVQFLSFYCSFLEHFGQIIGWHSHLGDWYPPVWDILNLPLVMQIKHVKIHFKLQVIFCHSLTRS